MEKITLIEPHCKNALAVYVRTGEFRLAPTALVVLLFSKYREYWDRAADRELVRWRRKVNNILRFPSADEYV